MIALGVNNIITDHPEDVRNLVNAWNELTGHEKFALMLRNLIVGNEPFPPSEL